MPGSSDMPVSRCICRSPEAILSVYMGFRRNIDFYFSGICKTNKCQLFMTFSDHDTTIMHHTMSNVTHGKLILARVYRFRNCCKYLYVPSYGSIVLHVYIFCKLTVSFLGSMLHVVGFLPHLNNKVPIKWYITLASQTRPL